MNVYYVDYSSLHAKPQHIDQVAKSKKNRIKIEGKPQQDVLDRIGKFKNWMFQKRYSTNTIKTYESMLLMFFGFHNANRSKTYPTVTLKIIIHAIFWPTVFPTPIKTKPSMH